jgi:hypothetical protein
MPVIVPFTLARNFTPSSVDFVSGSSGCAGVVDVPQMLHGQEFGRPPDVAVGVDVEVGVDVLLADGVSVDVGVLDAVAVGEGVDIVPAGTAVAVAVGVPVGVAVGGLEVDVTNTTSIQ